jgi:hypothetical protein
MKPLDAVVGSSRYPAPRTLVLTAGTHDDLRHAFIRWLADAAGYRLAQGDLTRPVVFTVCPTAVDSAGYIAAIEGSPTRAVMLLDRGSGRGEGDGQGVFMTKDKVRRATTFDAAPATQRRRWDEALEWAERLAMLVDTDPDHPCRSIPDMVT